MGKLVVSMKTGERYEMNIEQATDGKYAVCAYLFNNGDSIELIGS